MKDNKNRINELALRLKEGDMSVFNELYRLTSSKAYFAALHISGDEHEAQDIVQDSYVTMLAKISTLEKTEGFMSWFNRIVANKSKDFLRKKNPCFFADGENGNMSENPEDEEKASPESNAEREELRRTVMDAIKDLSDEKRACVMMKYFDDMSVNEIAETIDVPVSTVKNRLWAARKELKSVFEKKGISTAYVFAPFGIITWAVNSSFETFSQSFEGSQVAANILSGIAVAGGTAVAAGTAAAGTTAAVTAGSTAAGTAAKAVAASTLQKIAAGAAIAGVVTGSTIGITSVVKNKKDEIPEIPTTSYTEYADVQSAVIPIIEEQPINVADAVKNENKNKNENPKKYVGGNTSLFGARPVGLNTVGELKLGNNMVYFDDSKKEEFYYAEFYAEESGYYAFSQDLYLKTYYERNGKPIKPISITDVNVAVLFDDEMLGGAASSSSNGFSGLNYSLVYLEEGVHYPFIARNKSVSSFDMNVKYLGKEITGIEFADGVPEVVIGYNENMDEGTDDDPETFMQKYNLNISFSSGETLYLEKAWVDGFVEDGFKDGKNKVTFEFLDYEFEETLTAHHPDYYVKDIEITNIDEFCVAKIGYEGYDGIFYEEPESYEVIVTYADGTKETLDGATWNNLIKLDNGLELYVTFKTTEISEREALKFSVLIGEHEYFSRPCTVTKFDLLGFKLADIKSDSNFFWNVNFFIDNPTDFFRNSESFEEYVYNGINVVASVFPEMKNKFRILWEDEKSYAITLYKICTENEFNLEW